MLISSFKNCNIPIKIQLYKTYCSSLYYSHLWYNYSAKTINKVKVIYEQCYRRLFGLSKFDSITASMVENNVDSFDVLNRKYVQTL